MTHTPYVYRLTDLENGKRYIGSRYAKGCSPEDLGVKYFTSSKTVSKLFLKNPGRFEKQILVTGSVDYVIKVEKTMIDLYDAVLSDEFYNRTSGKAIHPDDIIRGNQILHAEKDGNGKSVVAVASAVKCHAIRDENGKSKVAVKNMTALHDRNRNEEGKSTIALNGLACVDRSLDENGKMKAAVNAAKKLHSVKNESGKSMVMVKLHAEKDERGKSMNSVRASQISHAKKDEQGRSLQAMAGHNERDENGKSILASRTIGIARTVRWRCLECGKEALAGPLGMHHKHSGHTGKERVV